MPRSWQEIYAEIVRLPAPERLRLLARLLADLAAETEAAASARPTSAPPTSGAPGPAPAHPTGSAAASAGAARPPARQTLPRPPEPERAAAGPRPRIVVDGSNFLGTVPGFDLGSAASRETLVLRLQEYAHAHPGTRVTVYFDGRKPSAAVRGGVEVRFSPDTRPADHYIVEYLRGVPVAERGACVLITGDAELSASARALGIRVEAPRRFQRRIAAPPAPAADRGLSPHEVAEWEEFFRRPKPDER